MNSAKIGSGCHAPVGGIYISTGKGEEVFYKGGQFTPDGFAKRTIKMSKSKKIQKLLDDKLQGVTIHPELIGNAEQLIMIRERKNVKGNDRPYQVSLIKQSDIEDKTKHGLWSIGYGVFWSIEEAYSYALALQERLNLSIVTI